MHAKRIGFRTVGVFATLSAAFAAAGIACSSSAPPVSGSEDFDAGKIIYDVDGSASKDGSVVGDADQKGDGSDSSTLGDGATYPDGALVDAGPIDSAVYDPPATCPTTLTLGTGTLVPSSTLLDDVGLSVTTDELTAAWTTSAAGLVTIHYVDRASKANAFGAEKTIGPTAAYAPERVALTSTGLGLAVVNANGLGFTYFSRTLRTDAFGAASVGPFQLLNDQGTAVLSPALERYADPVFARGGKYFIFSRYSSTSTTTVYVGTRIFDTDPYSQGTAYLASTLAPVGTQRKIVTSASDDVRTLFIYDQSVNKTRLIALNAMGNFVAMSDVGTMRDFQVSSTCAKFYYTQGTPGDIYSVP